MLFLSNNKNRTQLQPYKSKNQETWKNASNNNTIIVAKNVISNIRLSLSLLFSFITIII